MVSLNHLKKRQDFHRKIQPETFLYRFRPTHRQNDSKLRYTDPSGSSIKTPIPISLKSKATQIKSPDFSPGTLKLNFVCKSFKRGRFVYLFEVKGFSVVCGVSMERNF
ncbi:polyhomeotic-like protein 1 [Corchorus olitorius]|uniref:Polyhomeotic-like protein 1 n=1 Tax=Corchorus olitorius TaxID=93759 RepID=A0A1R3JI67_9ROSI|nr:polyhomeotic-like protein 1 [Corchorus olitorius]